MKRVVCSPPKTSRHSQLSLMNNFFLLCSSHVMSAGSFPLLSWQPQAVKSEEQITRNATHLTRDKEHIFHQVLKCWHSYWMFFWMEISCRNGIQMTPLVPHILETSVLPTIIACDLKNSLLLYYHWPGMELSWQSSHLAFTKLGVQSLATDKLAAMWFMQLKRWKQKDQKLQFILNYIVCSRLTWDSCYTIHIWLCWCCHKTHLQ